MAQVKIDLTYETRKSRPAWFKMIKELWKECDNVHEVPAYMINRELRKVGGRYCDASQTLIFPNEKNYTMWLLKWM